MESSPRHLFRRSGGRTQRKFLFPQVSGELNCNSRGSAGGTDCFMFYSSHASAFSFRLHPWRGWNTLSSLSKVTVQSVFWSSNKSAAPLLRFWIVFWFWVLFNLNSLWLPSMLCYIRILYTVHTMRSCHIPIVISNFKVQVVECLSGFLLSCFFSCWSGLQQATFVPCKQECLKQLFFGRQHVTGWAVQQVNEEQANNTLVSVISLSTLDITAQRYLEAHTSSADSFGSPLAFFDIQPVCPFWKSCYYWYHVVNYFQR